MVALRRRHWAATRHRVACATARTAWVLLGLMAVLVLLGAMNLWLMALLAVAAFGEKIWRLSRAVGVGLGLFGLAVLIGLAS